MKLGDDVVYVGCAHDNACPELSRPCSVDLYGAMELRSVRRDGRLVCRLDTGEFEIFEAFEVDTVEQVARSAAARVDDGYVDYDAGKGAE